MTEDFLALGLVTILGEQHEASYNIDSVSAKGTSAQGKGKADALMKSSALQPRIRAAVICSDCILSGFGLFFVELFSEAEVLMFSAANSRFI